MIYDVVIVGGGPAGLSAALALGRGRKHVLLCDEGPRRNALAEHVNNFVTRDGTPPAEFRRVGREQLLKYPRVELRDARVLSITGERGAFEVTLTDGVVAARRVLLCTGMIDEMLPIEGFSEVWGHSIFQCPYCHGWEVQDRPWGYLARAEHAARFLMFALQLRGWTNDLHIFTNGAFDVPEEAQQQLHRAGVRIETTPIRRLVAHDQRLRAIELSDGIQLSCEVLFAHPPQHHVELVGALGLVLDSEGFVQVDAMSRETSVPGVYAAGDLATRMQAAVAAAAGGMQAAAMMNFDLTSELVMSGAV